MLRELYAKWMVRWETALTTRDTNRIVRPLEWGFDCFPANALPAEAAVSSLGAAGSPPPDHLSGADQAAFHRMVATNGAVAARPALFFSYGTPGDFRIETRHPELFPTNVRPETLAYDAALREQAATGQMESASFLRFTSAIRTPHPENDVVNARWYPAHPSDRRAGDRRPRQALIVLPQWNADAFSHNALCRLANRFGISALRLSKPYHDIRRPAELERSDYAVSSNIGRTISACRQAVADIRSCIDWLETQGYTQFGVLGTSLGSCYAFIAASMDPRLEVCAFNHASTSFGDVVWTGQSTRHVRAAFEEAGFGQDHVRALFTAISPLSYMERFAAAPRRRSLVVHATWDLTFPREFSLDVLRRFDELGIAYTSRVLPCGHYTTGEFPFKYLDGWYLGSFLHTAFRDLAHAHYRAGSESAKRLER